MQQILNFDYFIFGGELSILFLFIYWRMIYKILIIYLFIFGCVGSSLLHRAFSSCGEQGLLLVVVCRLLIAVASLVAEHGLQVHGIQQLWPAGSRVQAQQLWHTGLVVPRHVGSYWTGLEPVSPALVGGFLTTCHQGSPKILIIIIIIFPNKPEQCLLY